MAARFYGRLVQGRPAGWWSIEVQQYEQEEPLNYGAMYAILFHRPDWHWCHSVLELLDGHLDGLANLAVAKYGGYSVYIPSVGYQRLPST